MAFGIKALLPTLAGAALTPFLGPMGAGLAVGGFRALQGGDTKDVLTSGLGAYGGGSLMEGLTKSGAASLADKSTMMGPPTPVDKMGLGQQMRSAQEGLTNLGSAPGRDAFLSNMGGGKEAFKAGMFAAAPMMLSEGPQAAGQPTAASSGNYRPYTLDRSAPQGAYSGDPNDTSERRYFNDTWTAGPVTPAKEGGLMALANGGAVKFGFGGFLGDVGTKLAGGFGDALNSVASIGGLGAAPAALAHGTKNEGGVRDLASKGMFGTIARVLMPSDEYVQAFGLADVPRYSYDAGSQRYQAYADGGIAALAKGGMSDLGSYSDGGQLLQGPGDGVSDDIPATIDGVQPARLADGEFVVPARIVSELGNGSTQAGAAKLYAMMERIQSDRKKLSVKTALR